MQISMSAGNIEQSCKKYIFRSGRKAKLMWKWSNISEVLKKKDCQPGILYPEKTALINQGTLKTSSNRQKFMKGSITSKSELQEMLKEVLLIEGKCTRWKSRTIQKKEEHWKWLSRIHIQYWTKAFITIR